MNICARFCGGASPVDHGELQFPDTSDAISLPKRAPGVTSTSTDSHAIPQPAPVSHDNPPSSAGYFRRGYSWMAGIFRQVKAWFAPAGPDKNSSLAQGSGNTQKSATSRGSSTDNGEPGTSAISNTESNSHRGPRAEPLNEQRALSNASDGEPHLPGRINEGTENGLQCPEGNKGGEPDPDTWTWKDLQARETARQIEYDLAYARTLEAGDDPGYEQYLHSLQFDMYTEFEKCVPENKKSEDKSSSVVKTASQRSGMLVPVSQIGQAGMQSHNPDDTIPYKGHEFPRPAGEKRLVKYKEPSFDRKCTQTAYDRILWSMKRNPEFTNLILEREWYCGTRPNLLSEKGGYESIRSRTAMAHHWLADYACEVKHNSGNGNNCFIISLLQHATGDYRSEQHKQEADELKEWLFKVVSPLCLEHGLIEESEKINDISDMLYPDKDIAEILLAEINRRYGSNMIVALLRMHENKKMRHLAISQRIGTWEEKHPGDNPVVLLQISDDKNLDNHIEAVVAQRD